MPATLSHIGTNFDRVVATGDENLIRLLTEARAAARAGLPDELTEEEKHRIEFQAAWKTFVTTCAELKIGDQIPGTVGRTYAKEYGKIKERAKRGAKVIIKLTPAAVAALATYGPEGLKVVDGELVFRNRKTTVALLEKAIKASRNDLVTPVKEANAKRTSLTALLRKVDIDTTV